MADVSVKLRVGLVGVTRGSGGFGRLGGFDGFGHGLGAVGRGECSSACALVSNGSWFVRLPLGGAWRIARWRCSAGSVGGSLRGAMLGVVVGPGRVSGGSAGGLGQCRRPVGCLWRGQAWLGWVRAAAARGALWPAGRIGSRPGVRASGFGGLRWQGVSSARDPGVAQEVPPVGLVGGAAGRGVRRVMLCGARGARGAAGRGGAGGAGIRASALAGWRGCTLREPAV